MNRLADGRRASIDPRPLRAVRYAMTAPRHVLLLGATGLVGGLTLERLLASVEVARVTAPTRRPIAGRRKLVNPVINFDQPPRCEEWWHADAAIYAMGTTRAKAGSTEEFRRIELDIALKLLKTVKDHRTARVVLISAAGADPRARSLYLRTKGELEPAVEVLGFPSLTIIRPSFIIGNRQERRVGERVAGLVLRALGPFVPEKYRAVQADVLAAALVDVALRRRD